MPDAGFVEATAVQQTGADYNNFDLIFSYPSNITKKVVLSKIREPQF